MVVLCLCRRVFSHGFDFLPSSGRPQLVMCSLPSTPPPPTTDHSCGTSHLKLQLPPLSKPVVIIICHTSIKDDVHIHHSFGCCSPPTSSPSFHHCPPSLPVMDIFLDLASRAASSFIPCLRIVACRPPDPICVVCSRTGAARAKCQAPSCCLHLPQWPAQCPSLCPTLNPTARPLTADSPRPHLRVSDPRRDRSQNQTNNNKKKFRKIPPLSSEKDSCHCSSNFVPSLFLCIQHLTSLNPWKAIESTHVILWSSVERIESTRALVGISFLMDVCGVHQGPVLDPICLCGFTC